MFEQFYWHGPDSVNTLTKRSRKLPIILSHSGASYIGAFILYPEWAHMSCERTNRPTDRPTNRLLGLARWSYAKTMQLRHFLRLLRLSPQTGAELKKRRQRLFHPALSIRAENTYYLRSVDTHEEAIHQNSRGEMRSFTHANRSPASGLQFGRAPSCNPYLITEIHIHSFEIRINRSILPRLILLGCISGG